MARITHVASAQQRYETVPVIDTATGEPKRTPVMRNGTQRTTKHGVPIFMTVTKQDRSKPLPLHECDAPGCGKPIEVGTSYKHVTPKSGPYGGRMRTRHESCPTWEIWELSNSWSARVAQAISGFDVSEVESPDDVTSALNDVASEIRTLAEESQEAAENIEEGFGHATQTSEDAAARADDLNSWADEIESVDVPELPEPEEDECDECQGEGTVDDEDEDIPTDGSARPQKTCEQCDGTGRYTPDEPTDEQMDEWRSEVEDACSIVQDSPV
jgi:hypothetical protein